MSEQAQLAMLVPKEMKAEIMQMARERGEQTASFVRRLLFKAIKEEKQAQQ